MPLRTIMRAWLIVCILLLSAGCQAAEATSESSRTASPESTESSALARVQRGAKLFNAHCAMCHGPTGESGAVALRGAALALDDAVMAGVIATGMPGKGMPAPAALSPDQIADLIAFIRSWEE